MNLEHHRGTKKTTEDFTEKQEMDEERRAFRAICLLQFC